MATLELCARAGLAPAADQVCIGGKCELDSNYAYMTEDRGAYMRLVVSSGYIGFAERSSVSANGATCGRK